MFLDGSKSASHLVVSRCMCLKASAAKRQVLFFFSKIWEHISVFITYYTNVSIRELVLERLYTQILTGAEMNEAIDARVTM
jgi:hypothetical protein